ncbi:MAG: hypothetical protein D6160_19605 [Ketobacter sp.]|nr:MAG: hypothetical protein D6160_19605 [Ketobacter sp.]
MNTMRSADPTKPLSVSTFSGSQGAALFVALIILLVVSLIGVSAIKSGIFHERMAFNAQSEEMSFQAAETGINAVIAEAEVNGGMLNTVLKTGTPLEHCVSRASGLTEGACDDASTIDIRASVNADALTEFEGKSPILGTDAAAFMYFEFSTIGDGSYADTNLPFRNRNYQGWRKIGPGNGRFSDDNNLLADSL